ncbi:hypothetical protein [Jiangella anatolica]|uniref:Uncharacterized protein n=1 Tax=Jiangella anatolica TaxID=2670374 RepID=A0A2W2BVF9_9ACTN|nr:hypothetical protein [Jiangella anatolica]PZF80149.1 hypothetical protein C1I92_27590 [Jiangella anatolica]
MPPFELEVFADRDEAEQATVPASVLRIVVGTQLYERDPAGTALLTADGGEWSPVPSQPGVLDATAFGLIATPPDAPQYMDEQLTSAVGYATLHNIAEIVFPPGLIFLEQPHVLPRAIRYRGTGGSQNTRFGTAASIYDSIVDQPTVTTFVACGTGAKEHHVRHVTEGTQCGFDRPNEVRQYNNAVDERFALLDLSNRDAVKGSNTPATLRPVSALLSFEETFERINLEGIRIIPSCPDPALGEVDGVGGYKRDDAVLPYADWDFGIIMSNPWGAHVADVNVVGYWRLGAILNIGFQISDSPIGGTPNAEHQKFTGCATQGGMILRTGDMWPVVDKDAGRIWLRWTPSQQFSPTGGTVTISARDTFGGSNYTYTGTTYESAATPNNVTDILGDGWIVLNDVRPAGSGSNDTSAIQTVSTHPTACSKVVPVFSGGHSHTRFEDCTFTDLAHAAGIDEANPVLNAAGLPGREKYSTALEWSGAPMRALEFSNCLMTTSGPRTMHVGMARETTFSDCYAETRPWRTALNGALDGARGGLFIAGANAALANESGVAGHFSMNLYSMFNDIINMVPYGPVRAGSRMAAQTDVLNAQNVIDVIKTSAAVDAQGGLHLQTVSHDDLANAASMVNRVGKAEGKVVWELVNNRLYIALASGATSLWTQIGGPNSIAPI